MEKLIKLKGGEKVIFNYGVFTAPISGVYLITNDSIRLIRRE